jgi:CMP-N,N'-diacetyllegionaminic acid synthase
LIHTKSVLALITARGGSKGLPGKNIRPLLGKPLIAWSIEQAKVCKYIDRIVVSTDDEEIAKVSEAYGAEVPFLRPAALATDTASSIDVSIHAIEFFEKKNVFFDYFVMLEPTSPLRGAEDIDKALEELDGQPTAESIVGVAMAESTHPDFLLRIKNGLIEPYQGQKFRFSRRQDLDDIYYFEGSLYVSYCSSLKKRKTFYHNATLPYVVPKFKSYEIDDLDDFIIVEALLTAKEEGVFD